jgi:M6 family metalloprotease-like protein
MGGSTRSLLVRFLGLAASAWLIAGVPSAAGAEVAATTMPRWRCAGPVRPDVNGFPRSALAKTAQSPVGGTRSVVVLFGRFADQPDAPVPNWAAQLLDPAVPGSFSHYWETMSCGALHLRGIVAPRRYAARDPASAYLAAGATGSGDFGRLARDLVAQADADVDFAQADNDGPDGVPSSGDDDGRVDAVIVVLAQVPAGLLRGEATGIASLGMGSPFATNDRSARGGPVRIDDAQGAILQGRAWAETAGAMCHEYGHLLGLRDLYNVGFVQRTDGDPVDDSAGVGCWDLMGWGALGWFAGDGPASLSAYSRWSLGWAQVQSVIDRETAVALEDVGRQGCLLSLLLPGAVTGAERFLIEYRTRGSSYYDRHIPGEGLLVWHVNQGRYPPVDLECADGRWQDAGYPLGRFAAPHRGSDNLDFWAHDAAYALAHGGNLGDATDPFDGSRFTAFTPHTNPSAVSDDSSVAVHIEQIRRLDGRVQAQLRLPPPCAFTAIQVDDANADGVLVAGAAGVLRCQLDRVGGLRTSTVRVRATSHDPGLRLVGLPEAVVTYADPWAGPFQVSVAADFPGARSVVLGLEVDWRVQLRWETLWRDEVRFEVVSPWQPLAAVTVIDTLGNGDGRVQAGEWVRLRLRTIMDRPELMPALAFRLRSLGAGVQLQGPSAVSFAAAGHYGPVSTDSPEFLVNAAAMAGDSLRFDLEVASGFSSWHDTLAVVVAPGGDATAPRVPGVRASRTSDGWRYEVASHLILDGGPLAAVAVLVSCPPETVTVAVVPLELSGHTYAGTWSTRASSQVLAVQARAADAAGNVGYGPRQPLPVDALAGSDTSAVRVAGDPVCWRDGATGYRVLAWAPDGGAIGAADGAEVQLLRPDNLTWLATLGYHPAVVTSLAFAPDGRQLAAASADGTITVWALDGQATWSDPAPAPGPVTGLGFSPDGRLLAAVGWGSGLRRWQTDGWGPVVAGGLERNLGTLALAFEPNAGRVAVSDTWGRLTLSPTLPDPSLFGAPGAALRSAPDLLPSLAFSADGSRLLGGCRDGSLYLWDVTVPQARPVRWPAHIGWVNAVAWHPRGHLVASAGSDGMIRLWGMPAAWPAGTCRGPLGAVAGLAFSPDGRYLAATSRDGTLRLWLLPPAQAQPDSLPAIVLGHPYPSPARRGVWLPYQMGLAAACRVRMYNLAGQCLRTLDLGLRQPGWYTSAGQAAYWDGRDDQGRTVGSGVYLCVFDAGAGTRPVGWRKVALVH